jgi:hypothetical protein
VKTVEGLPNPIVKKGLIDVWDTPGLGVSFNVRAAKAHLSEEDRTFIRLRKGSSQPGSGHKVTSMVSISRGLVSRL